MQEKRSYVRSKGLVLVEYKGEQLKGKSCIFDVSGAGLRLTLDKKLETGFRAELEIYLPGNSKPIKTEGKIVWVEKAKEQPDFESKTPKEYFYSGIKFIDISNWDREKIANFVYRECR